MQLQLYMSHRASPVRLLFTELRVYLQSHTLVISDCLTVRSDRIQLLLMNSKHLEGNCVSLLVSSSSSACYPLFSLAAPLFIFSPFICILFSSLLSIFRFLYSFYSFFSIYCDILSSSTISLFFFNVISLINVFFLNISYAANRKVAGSIPEKVNF
jgi:hypothetical protein